MITALIALSLILPSPVFALAEQTGGTPEVISYPAPDATIISAGETGVRALSSRSVKAKKIKKVNLRKMIRENSDGCAVVQGGCTDGKYAYYLMVSAYTQKGRVLKVRIKNNKVVKRSKVLNIHHGNGMAYDSKRKKLVVIARGKRKQEITLIDAKTLKITRQQDAKYSNYKNAKTGSLTKIHQKQGLAAIAYVKRYDCYIAFERVYHNLIIFDPDTFQAIGFVHTDIDDDKYPGLFQGMDADKRYVYLLLSPCYTGGRRQTKNLILALDWNSENLLDDSNKTASGGRPFIKYAWACNNDGSGRPDAAITLNTKRESENIFHTTDKNGREHFYLSEYYSHIARKKSGVKYFRRDNYVYDLGIF